MSGCLLVYLHSNTRLKGTCKRERIDQIEEILNPKNPPSLPENLRQIPFQIPFQNETFNSTFLILPELNRCNDTFLLSVILSSPSNFDIRQTIRNTWASRNQDEFRSGSIQTIFLIGSGDLLEKRLLEREADDHRDILLVSFQDTYRNLVLKSLSLLYYHEHFCQARFLLKIDDDVVFSFPRFMHFFNDTTILDQSAAIYGKVWNHSRPERDPRHRWYISLFAYTAESLPPFCSGPSYVMNRQAVHALLNKTQDVPLIYNVEDVFITGILAEYVGVKRVQMNRSIFPQNYSGVLSLLGVPCDSKRIPYVFSIHGWKNSTQLRRVWIRMKYLKCRRTMKVKRLDEGNEAQIEKFLKTPLRIG